MADKAAVVPADATSTDVETLREDWAKAPDDLDVALTFDEALAQAAADGFDEADIVFIASAYVVMNKDKDALLGVPFWIRWFRFGQDKVSKKYYVVFYAIAKDADSTMYVVTDGSTGIKEQLVKLYNSRKADGHPSPDGRVIVANGLRKSDYIYTDPSTGAQSEATTYYLA